MIVKERCRLRQRDASEPYPGIVIILDCISEPVQAIACEQAQSCCQDARVIRVSSVTSMRRCRAALEAHWGAMAQGFCLGAPGLDDKALVRPRHHLKMPKRMAS